jgi:hypothetical protein
MNPSQLKGDSKLLVFQYAPNIDQAGLNTSTNCGASKGKLAHDVRVWRLALRMG